MFKTLFGFLGAKNKDPKVKTADIVMKKSAESEIVEKMPEPKGFSFASRTIAPVSVGSAQREFHYESLLNVINQESLNNACKAGKWELTPKLINDMVYLFSEEIDVARLCSHELAVKAWMSRGKECRVIIKSNNSETGCAVSIGLYRNFLQENAWRESDITPLQAYKSKAKQEAIECLHPGVRCNFHEESRADNKLLISYHGDIVGTVPKKFAKRYYEEGAVGVYYIDYEFDYSSENIAYKPIFQIFWGADENQGVSIDRIMASKDKQIEEAAEYAVVDVETTGLDPKTCRIIEIAIIKVRDGKIVEEYCTLVDPGAAAFLATHIHGISDKDLIGKPDYFEIAPTVARLLIGSVVVAHNAPFDLGFIKNLLDACEYTGEIKAIDTLAYSKRAVKGLNNYKLATLISHLGLSGENSHRALDDAKATQLLFEKCKKLIVAERDKKKAERKAAKMAQSE